jgi:hypothetical protein
MNAIFSIFHKEYFVPKNKIIFPILVGKNKDNILLNTNNMIYRDDIGNNISNLNSYFSELTAMYWIWKNFNQNKNDFVGIAHYRRYLILNQKRNILQKLKSRSFNYIYSDDKYRQFKHNEKLHNNVSENGINRILANKSIILPIPNQIIINNNIYTAKEQYLLEHIETDWNILEESLKLMYPQYSKTFNEFAIQTYMSIGNMFICKRDIFDAYCNWLFPLLFDIKEKISISKDEYQARVIGFMAERLLNIYVYHNFKKEEISYLPIYYILN